MTDFSMNQGDTNERRHDDLPRDGGDRSDSAAVDQLLSKFDFGDLLASLDAFHAGDAEGGDEVDAVLDEEAGELACAADQELAVAALSSLPDLGAEKRRKKDTGLKAITEEDFEEGAERISYQVLKANIECLFDKKSKADKLIQAAHWVFGRTVGEWSMEGCCLTLGARRDVLRLRIHYEFWRRWIVFPIPFPFLIDNVPDTVEGQIFMEGGDEGYALARAAWLQPGIRTAQLLEEAMKYHESTEEKVRKALQALSEEYILSQQTDSWYLTGRNPILRSIDLSQSSYRLTRSQLSWSRMF